MAVIWTIARREYRQYFSNPAAYIIAAVILLVIGMIFYAMINTGLQQQFVPSVADIVSTLAFLLIFTIPAITMRTLSEEARLGTIELLLTAPVRDWEVVVGKWLGAFLFVASIIGITLVYPVILNNMVDPGIDQGAMISAYLGLLLTTAAFVAIGVMVSSFFENQIASFILSMGLFIVAWWLLSIPGQLGGSTFSEVMRYLDFNTHFATTMMRGVISSTDIVYFLSVIVFSLSLGALSLETRRWR